MNAVRDGESVLMGVNDENECHLWVMAMYRATGQSHKPTPPTTSDTHHKIMGGKLPITNPIIHQNTKTFYSQMRIKLENTAWRNTSKPTLVHLTMLPYLQRCNR